MEKSILNFFLDNKDSLSGYVDSIKVNHEKTVVKYAYKKGINFSITVLIYGELDESITNYEGKVNCFLNTDSDLTELNEFINKIKLPYTIHFNPFIKISKENEVPTHAFNIAVKFIKG